MIRRTAASFLFILILLSASIGTSCSCNNPELILGDVPFYPEAELVMTRSWTDLPSREPVAQIDWCYFLVEDKHSASQISHFYTSELLARGWLDESASVNTGTTTLFWRYLETINLYVPVEMVGRPSSWIYYSKNNQQDWLVLLIGLERPWLESDKTPVIIIRAK